MVQTAKASTSGKKKNANINYVAHLNAWYACLQRDRRLTSSHISLYTVLFFHWNANWFRNPIVVYRDEMMEISRVGSRNTYAKCLRELAEWGYIVYGSESRARGSTIEMVALAKDNPRSYGDDTGRLPVASELSNSSVHDKGEGEFDADRYEDLYENTGVDTAVITASIQARVPALILNVGLNVGLMVGLSLYVRTKKIIFL